MPQTMKQALIHDLYKNPLSGEDIENRSFSIIDEENKASQFTSEQWPIVRRMIHTTADFDLLRWIRFSRDSISSGTSALKSGCQIYVDSNMIRAGISIARLQRVNPIYSSSSIHCHVADSDVAESAKQTGLPRSLFAVRKAIPMLENSIAIFGNAPVALMELNRLIIESDVRPALVIAMPVGFVHVIESKDELMSLDIPYICIAGRRGGSPLAVSALHALCGLVNIL